MGVGASSRMCSNPMLRSLALALALVVVAGERRAEAEPCPTDPVQARAVVDAVVVSAEPPQYRCAPHAGLAPGMMDLLQHLLPPEGPAGPTSDTGCLVLSQSPYCEGGVIELEGGRSSIRPPSQIGVKLDGTAHRVGYTGGGEWQLCGIAPGSHELAQCVPGGTLRCRVEIQANAVASYTVERTEPRLRLRVERTWLGAPARGDEVVVAYHDRVPDGPSYEPPGRGTFTWRETGDAPRAQMCTAPARAPGCSRCSGVEPDMSGLLWIALSIAAPSVAALRRPRRRR